MLVGAIYRSLRPGLIVCQISFVMYLKSISHPFGT